MNYNLFDKRFLYVVPDEDAKALVGKKVFWCDIIVPFINGINGGVECEAELIGVRDTPVESSYPFKIRSSGTNTIINAAYIYYDPYYNLKLAKAKGKTIQFLDSTCLFWNDLETDNISWSYSLDRYRIKPEDLWYVHTRKGGFTIDKSESDALYSAVDYNDCRRWIDVRLDDLCTNRELAEWLAKGNGQVSSRASIACGMVLVYKFCEDDVKVLDETLVRRWDDTEWHKPTKRYIYGLELING